MIDIYFVVLPHTVLLDLAGPAEAFRIANQVLNKAVSTPEKEKTREAGLDKFQLHFVGPSTTIASSIGVHVSGLEPLPSSFDPEVEQVWVALLGLPSSVKQAVIKDKVWFDTRRWLVKTFAPHLLATDQDRFKLVSVCAGALLAADAGLLSNRQCTTHHELLEQLRCADTSAQVVSNRVFVEDGPVLTSGGITAGIDLALHLIAATCSHLWLRSCLISCTSHGGVYPTWTARSIGVSTAAFSRSSSSSGTSHSRRDLCKSASDMVQ